jgi:hypothetical protein
MAGVYSASGNGSSAPEVLLFSLSLQQGAVLLAETLKKE